MRREDKKMKDIEKRKTQETQKVKGGGAMGYKKGKVPNESLYQSYKPPAAKRSIELGHQMESQDK